MVVIKQFKLRKSDSITNDVVKEILILKQMNEYNYDGFCKIYGLAHSDGDGDGVPTMFMVMEPLVDIFKKLKLTKKEYKIILYKLLLSVYQLHKHGYHHSDIKPVNIMYKDGNVKLIDFGVSDFLGVSPIIKLLKQYLCTPTTKAPDNKLWYKYGDKRFIEKGYVEGNRKSYQSDVFTVISTWIQIITGNKVAQVYLDIKNGVESIMMLPNINKKHSNITNSLEEIFGKECIDLLINCLLGDITKRFCCKQALNHKFFY